MRKKTLTHVAWLGICEIGKQGPLIFVAGIVGSLPDEKFMQTGMFRKSSRDCLINHVGNTPTEKWTRLPVTIASAQPARTAATTRPSSGSTP